MDRKTRAARIAVVESPAGVERLAAAAAFLRGFPPSAEILLIGASREAADELVQRLALEGAATFGVQRFTLLQLAAHLAAPRIAELGLAPAPGLTAASLGARAVFEALERGELHYFEPVARYPGFPRALSTTLNELRLAGLPVETLRGCGAAADDIFVLLSRYAEQLREGRLADKARLLEIATEVVHADTAPPAGLPLLLLDLPVRSPAEARFLAALCRASSRVLATVPRGDGEARQALEEIGAEVRPTVPDQAPQTGLDRLRLYLFATQTPPAAEPDDSVSIFSAPGESRECVEIARLALDHARRGTAFDDMAVFLRAPEVYTPLLQTAFRRAGVPAYFARGTKAPDPSGRAFLALLHCVAERFSARRFAEYLSFGQVPRADSGAKSPAGDAWAPPLDPMAGDAAAVAAEALDVETVSGAAPEPLEDEVENTIRAPRRWETFLVEAAVIGGAERWERRLAGLEREWRLQLEAVRAEEPEGPKIARLERDLAHLAGLRDFALPLIRSLAQLPAHAPWSDWLARLADLAPVVLRRPARVLAVLGELSPLGTMGSVGIEEVRDLLSDRLLDLEEEAPKNRYGRIFVAAPEGARGRTFAVVFLPGLAERIFPQRLREDPLLLDAVREKVSPGLDLQPRRVDRERLLLRLTAGAARERIVLSYPRVDVVEARPRVTSFYGLDVVRATRGAIPDPEAFEREAAGESGGETGRRVRLAWPAPSDPTLAIDAIEHDLAVLDGLLREADPGRVKGRARYLIELNPHLARSLRSRWARWRPEWRPHDGLIEKTDTVAEALAAHRLAARPYSVSALQRYAVCPYQFLLAAIHRLEPRKEAVELERLDPLTRGKLFHQVQAETLRALRREALIPLAAEDLPRAAGILDVTLQRIADEYFDEVAPPIHRVWQDEIAAMRSDLQTWLKHVRDASATWEALHCEFGFGLSADPQRDRDSVAQAVTLAGGARLRGSVDLIERRRSDGLLRVTDHKTGSDRVGAAYVVGGGEILQPVLYSLAVEAALGARVAEARLFYCTSRGGFREHAVSIDDRARRAGIEVLEIVDRAIAGGVLPPAPREDACKVCDFRPVCGPYEERRIGRKDQRLLADLEELRRRV